MQSKFAPDRSRLGRWMLQGVAVVAFLAFAAWHLYSDPFGRTLVVGAGIAFGIYRIRRLYRWYRRDALLILDEQGLTDYTYGLGFVPWSNISAARLHRYARPRFNPLGLEAELIVLEFRDPEAYFAASDDPARSGVRKGLAEGRTGFWINTGLLEQPENLILQEIRKRIGSSATTDHAA